MTKRFNVIFLNKDYTIIKDNKIIRVALKQVNVYTLNVIYLTTRITTLIKYDTKVLVISLLYNNKAIKL